MNSSTPEGGPQKSGFGDHARLLLGAVACAVLAVAVLPFEASILGVCNLGPVSGWIGFWHWVSRSAPAVLLSAAVILGVVLLTTGTPSARRRRSGFALLFAFLVTSLVTNGIKAATGRARPLADVPRAGKLWSPLDLRDDRSFPSGHVSAATAVCAALWLAGRRGPLRNCIWVVPPIMMFDRLCLAAHWPSDVLGGAAVGLATTSLVASATRFEPVDRVLALMGRGGSPLARFLLFAFAWLVVTGLWGELPLGRDPVSGQVVPGFSTKPQTLRAWLEPLLGPVLHLALEDLKATVLPGVAWTVLIVGIAALLLRRFARRVFLAIGILIAAWITLFLLGWAPPDRFVAKDRTGVFVDWHLHAGDPYDGKIPIWHLASREMDRGVRWPILTQHGRTDELRHITDSMQWGLFGAEWSGPLPVRPGAWTQPHFLVLGQSGAVESAASPESRPLDAARDASARGALVIVAHYWRSQASIPDCPTFEQFVEAGVHGFEIGNRRRDTDPEAVARVRDLDRKCREKGLLRFSFSDDHGIPSGSPCVTFLEGLGDAEIQWGVGPAVVERLRQPGGGGITPIPLLFHPGDPTVFPPRWLAPPVVAIEYFRSLRLPQRIAWLLYCALAGLWIFGRRHKSAPPGYTSGSP